MTNAKLDLKKFVDTLVVTWKVTSLNYQIRKWPHIGLVAYSISDGAHTGGASDFSV